MQMCLRRGAGTQAKAGGRACTSRRCGGVPLIVCAESRGASRAPRTKKSWRRGGPPETPFAGSSTAKRGRNARRLKRRTGKIPDGRSHSCPRGGGAPPPQSCCRASTVAGTASTAASLPAHSQIVCIEGVRPARRSDLRLFDLRGGFMPGPGAVTMPVLPCRQTGQSLRAFRGLRKKILVASRGA